MDCHIVVAGGYTSVPYVYSTAASTPCMGYVRVNSGNYETFDGATWQHINTQPVSVGLTPQASMAISWAIQKQAEEIQLNKLCDLHPELQRAKEQFENVIALTKQLEEQRVEYEKKLANANTFANKVVEDVNKVTAERDELQSKLNTWTVIAT